MKRTLTLLAILAFSTGVLAQDQAKATNLTNYGDLLYLDSRTALTGTWTCTTSSLNCTSAAGDAQNELADQDVVELCGYRYVVNGEPADANTIAITPHRVASTGALRTGATAACAAQAGYKANLGLTGTAAVLKDGSGTASTVSVSTTGVTNSGTAAMTQVNAAGGSANPFDYTGTLGIMNGSDDFTLFDVNITNANHTGTPNTVQAIDIAGITGDADATETAINIGAGWDSGITSASPITGSALTTAGAVTAGTAAIGGGHGSTGLSIGADGTLLTDGGIDAEYGVYVTGTAPWWTMAANTVTYNRCIWYEGGTNDANELQLCIPGGYTDAGDVTGELVALDAAVNDGQLILGATSATSVLTFAGADAAGNWTLIDFSGAGGINDASDYLLYSSANNNWDGSGTMTASRVVQKADGLELQDYCGHFSQVAVNAACIGKLGIALEGATADTDELTISYPSYSDGGAGNQGGESDPTATMMVGRCISETIADSGDGNPATDTFDPAQHANCWLVTCSDADSCDVTMAETNAYAGQIMMITSTGANAVDLADQAGILNINGGAIALVTDDTLTLMYTGTQWLEISRSDN